MATAARHRGADAEELRADDEQIKKLPVRVGETGLVPLGQLVEFKTLKAVEPIRRDDGQRRAALMVNLSVRDVESFVREAERRIKEQVKLPEDYIVEFGGSSRTCRKPARGSRSSCPRRSRSSSCSSSSPSAACGRRCSSIPASRSP